MQFLERLQESCHKKKISEKIYQIFITFYQTYAQAVKEEDPASIHCSALFTTLLLRVEEQVLHPHRFSPYHQRVETPFNYYQFGLDFIRPLVDKRRSQLLHSGQVIEIDQAIARGESVVLLANHQTEVDPQLLSLALEERYPRLAREVIFVAGERVLVDPLAIPFSLGRNLLCIYSKRHIDNPPEKKEEKLQHNQKTMQVMKHLFSEGGKCVYVAPSGGRDRPDIRGRVHVAPFDAQSVEMFRLIARNAARPVHFYPLSLATFDILPPPNQIQAELGEMRHVQRTAAHFAFGERLPMDLTTEDRSTDRHQRRQLQAERIWQQVETNYLKLLTLS